MTNTQFGLLIDSNLLFFILSETSVPQGNLQRIIVINNHYPKKFLVNLQ